MSKQVDVLGLTGFDAWLTSPPEGPKWHEPKDEHEAKAMEELAADMNGLSEILTESAWIAEHASFLFTHSESFRAEVLTARKTWLADKARQIAEEEAGEREVESKLSALEARHDR